MDDLEACDEETKKIEDDLESIKNYLGKVRNDLIYETYREAIVCDHTRTFADFKQEHRDAYLRLKMRGMRPSSFI